MTTTDRTSTGHGHRRDRRTRAAHGAGPAMVVRPAALRPAAAPELVDDAPEAVLRELEILAVRADLPDIATRAALLRHILRMARDRG